MIEFSHVSKLFGAQKAVNDLNLNFQEGSFSVLIGTSGSGKSTTLKMINRLVEHDSGEIRFAGEEIRSLPVLELRRRMGYAIQSIGLFPHWSVAQNIATVPQHDIDEALRLAEHLVLMDHGEVVQQGNPLTMLTRPANDFVRQFFGRSELGVRLLSLRSVADYVRREERAEGEALAEEMTLRDALSLFVARGCEVLPVMNTQGQPCGTLHFQDLLEEA
ncbi:MAG: ABC transporter ATP-binding protein [Escherichia coli]|nr:ABC transporter ATP-binding protein [Escherichia coli]